MFQTSLGTQAQLVIIVIAAGAAPFKRAGSISCSKHCILKRGVPREWPNGKVLGPSVLVIPQEMFQCHYAPGASHHKLNSCQINISSET